ncbi:MAG: Gfo/Idh/MocA family oxidoreductase [Bacteroidota bacterium]
MQIIRWGILGPGNIARKFSTGLRDLAGAKIQAVASSNMERAQEFAKDFQVPNVYDKYEKLANDPDVDIIYVATTHNFHEEHALLCIEAGKSVLVEKPIATNLIQAENIVRAAREKGVFLMEAMWTRFIPAWVEIRKWLKEERIGKIKYVKADFGFFAEWDPLNRKFNPALAGGALLDIGIYPIALAYMIFEEEPSYVGSFASLCETGVDEQSSYLFGYENGAMAELSSCFTGETYREALIMGSKGQIRVPLFWKAQEAFLLMHGEEEQHFEFSYDHFGLQCQAEWVMQALREKKQETAWMPWSESLRIMKRMDSLRASWGMKYPWES